MLVNLAAGDVFAIFIWTYLVFQNILFIEVGIWITIEQIRFWYSCIEWTLPASIILRDGNQLCF